MKIVYGIGVGPGDKELITLKAINILKGSDYVFIPRSRGESLAGSIASEYISDKKIIELDFPMGEDNGERYEKAAAAIEETLKNGERASFLTLGDPMTYSTYIYLMMELTKLNIEVETIPGITSFGAAASKLQIPLTLKDESFYLCDGEVDEEILKRVNTIGILKVKRDLENTIRKLEENGFKFTYVKRCTQREEKIITDKEEMLLDGEYMALIIGRRE